jgi:hypothetical protein
MKKKTLNAFIKQSAQLKKGDSFVDNNPQARSNPYEPEISIREGIVGTAKNMGIAGASGSVAKTLDDAGTSVGAPYLTQNASGATVAAATAQAAANRASAKLAAKAALSKAKATATGKTVGVGTKALNAGSKVFNIASKGAGLAGLGVAARRIPAVAAGLAAYDAYKGYNAQPNATFGRKVTNAGQNALSGFTMGYLVDPPKGIKEGILDTLILRGAKAATPIVTKVLGNLEKRVAAKAAAKAAAKDTTNVVKTAAPKVTPKFEPEVARRAGTIRSSTPITPRVPKPVKVAAPSKPVVPSTSSKLAAMSKTTGKIKSALRGDTARFIGAQLATQGVVDAALPNFHTAPGQDQSYAPKGVDPVGAVLTGATATLAGADKTAWKRGVKYGLPLAAAMQGINLWKAKYNQSTPEYKAADAAARGQQPK